MTQAASSQKTLYETYSRNRKSIRRMAVPLIFVAILFFIVVLFFNIRTQLASLKARSQEAFENAARLVDREFVTTDHDTALVQEYMRYFLNAASPYYLDQDFLRASIETLMISTQHFEQVRWIDIDGMERFRMIFDAQGLHQLGPSELQDRSDTYYFREAADYPPDLTYYSPLDLSRRGTELGPNYEPVLRTARTLEDDAGRKQGMVVLNLWAREFLEGFDNILQEGILHLHLLNSEGYWLTHPDSSLEWGFVTGDDSARLAAVDPEAWRVLQEGSEEFALTTSGLWMFRQMAPVNRAFRPWHAAAYVSTVDLWTSVVARQVVPALVYSLLLFALGYLCLALLASLWAKEREHLDSVQIMEREIQEKAENLATARKELVRLDRLSSLGLMVAGVAHELNTPIGNAKVAISFVHDTLNTSKLDPPGVKPAIMEGIEISERSLDSAIGILRDFRRLAIDRSSLEAADYRLSELIEPVITACQLQLRMRAEDIHVSLMNDAVCHGFPGVVSQILENLIINAVKHGYPDRTGIDVNLRILCEGEMVRIVVEDRGRGIPLEKQKDLFVPFYTTDRSTGTGLGLYLVFHYVTQYLGGDIYFYSREGEGTRVVLELPRRAPSLPVEAGPVPTDVQFG